MIKPIRVLLVDPTNEWRQMLLPPLEAAGHLTAVVETADMGWRVFRDLRPHVVLLTDALSADVRQALLWRLKRMAVPVVLLTKNTSTPGVVQSLDSGIDTVFTRSLPWEECSARLRSLLKRWPHNPDQAVQVGGLNLNRTNRKVMREERPVVLTRMEFDVLEVLALNPNQPLTMQDIRDLAELKGDQHSNLVTVCIHHLRTRLEKAGEPRLIRTVRSKGYLLQCPPSP